MVIALSSPQSLAQLLRARDSVTQWSKAIPDGMRLYAMKQNIFNYNPCCGLTLVGKLLLHRCSFTAPSTSCVVGEEKSKSKTEKTCGPR